jgi:tetratricopeptide (TPR) repeat protein
MANDSASKFALYELADDNAKKAIELGVSPNYVAAYRRHARNLIESNHCEEGLQETQNLINLSKAGDPNMDNYNISLTEAYTCLGELDKALETAQLIQCDDPVTSCRTMFLAEIYFQSGESEKALEILNYLINWEPTYGGWRYFIRALIYYEQGEKELALQDLATGDNYTWYGNGVYWYVKAKMAFDDGDDQNGMLYLQYAESTLDVQYTPLRQKILKELTARGGNPLIISPQVPLATTPIP